MRGAPLILSPARSMRSQVWHESIDAGRVLDDAEIDISADLHDEVAGVLQGSVLPGNPAFSVRVTSTLP